MKTCGASWNYEQVFLVFDGSPTQSPADCKVCLAQSGVEDGESRGKSLAFE